jgi:hypothetical protein
VVDAEHDYLLASLAFGWGQWKYADGEWVLIMDGD